MVPMDSDVKVKVIGVGSSGCSANPVCCESISKGTYLCFDVIFRRLLIELCYLDVVGIGCVPVDISL